MTKGPNRFVESPCSISIRAALLVCVALSLVGCGRFIYGVDALNFGHTGVMVLQIGDRHPHGPHPAYVELGVHAPMIAGRPPSIPSKYRDPASGLGHFEGHRTSLPDEVEIVWQLAELKDCKSETKVRHDANLPWLGSRAQTYGPEEFIRKSDCTWHPLPDKVYRQQLDMQAIRNSEAYRKTGRRADGVAGSRYTLNLTLVFIEDRLIVEVDNGATNPWL